MKRKTSITELMKKKKLSDTEWSQLAFYSWGQNRGIENLLGVFEKLYNKVPQRLSEERAAFLINYLRELSSEKKVKRDKTSLGKEFVKLINQSP